MSWALFWQEVTIAFFAGMAVGVWISLRRSRITVAQPIVNATPPTTAELQAGVFTQSAPYPPSIAVPLDYAAGTFTPPGPNCEWGTK